MGEQTQTITVTATDDTDDDDGESVLLTFADDPGNRVQVRSQSHSARVLLADDDGVEEVTVSFGAPTYTATEGGADATVVVELSAAPGRAVTIPLTKEHLGGATAADYSLNPASVTFGADRMETTFDVTATPDTDADGGESVRLGFGTLPDGVVAGSSASASVALADGSEQRFVVSFSTSSGHTVQVREGARRLRLRVLLRDSKWAPSANPRHPVTIPLVVTHTGGASEADYMPIPESVTIAAGQSEAAYYVRALPDDEDETGEGLRIDFGPLPPGVTRNDWGPYETIEFVDADAANLSVAGPLLTPSYSDPLDVGSKPSPRDFVAAAVAPGGAKDMVAPDETVTLTYLTAAMHPIRDAAGLPAPPLADEPVRNETGAFGPLAEAALPAGTATPPPLAALLQEAQEGAGMQRLDLSSRNLTDISALTGLRGLRELDLSPLSELTGLEALHLSGNPVSDAAPLGRLEKLLWLWIDSGTAAGMEALAPPARGGAGQLWIELAPAQ